MRIKIDNSNDKRIIFISRLAYVMAFSLLLVVGLTTMGNNPRPRVEYSRDYTIEDIDDGNTVYTFDWTRYNHVNSIAFYSNHYEVEAYGDGELIYEFKANHNPIWGKTPGSNWNFVHVFPNTQQVTIKVSSVYKNTAHVHHRFYVANDIDIYEKIVEGSIPSFIISVMTFVMGLGMVIYWLFIKRDYSVGKAMYHLGWFSVILSNLVLNETGISMLINHNRLVSMVANYVWLMIIAFPFVLFVRAFLDCAPGKWWKIDFVIIFCIDVIIIGMHLLGIRDFGENRMLLHLILIITVVYVVAMSIEKARFQKISGKTKNAIIAVAILGVSMLVDIASIYLRPQSSEKLGIFGYIIFVLIISRDIQISTMDRLKKVHYAQTWKDIAMLDSMTGFYSRNAYDADIDKTTDWTNMMVVNCDLNNLKKCNDTMGHMAGDKYIKDCAQVIYEEFRLYGRCYRIGGDEFCILIDKADKFDIRKAMTKIYARTDEMYSAYRHNFIMGVAIGYAIYDESADEDIEDTIKRADVMMYREKEILKKKYN